MHGVGAVGVGGFVPAKDEVAAPSSSAVPSNAADLATVTAPNDCGMIFGIRLFPGCSSPYRRTYVPPVAPCSREERGLCMDSCRHHMLAPARPWAARPTRAPCT